MSLSSSKPSLSYIGSSKLCFFHFDIFGAKTLSCTSSNTSLLRSFVFSSIYPGWLACIEQIQTIFKKSINVSPIDATLNVIVFAKMILQLH